MFENLTDKLQGALRNIRGQARLSESNISDAMKEIRAALLEADVNYKIVREFIEDIKKECLGIEVLKTVTPGQQVVKVVYDKLVELMGNSEEPLNLRSTPSVIMMVGLHGSGKTTSAAKLALNLRKSGKKVLLGAGDIYRPAAIDQLEVLGAEVEVPVHSDRSNPNVAIIARNAVNRAKKELADVVIIDTAGRLQIDEQMVQELVQVQQAVMADEILLVADSALGQEAVSVAEHFHKALGLTGLVLSKLDGDARGGAALSMRKVTGCPIKYVGVGEKIDDLEIFYPDRMASRILGMGDVVSLVEKAAEEIDEEEALKLREKLKKNSFDFNDFLGQLRQMSKMGGIESIMKMLPGGKQLADSAAVDEDQFKYMEAIICSMTTAERENADLIDFSRKKRISTGSGTSMEQVGQLLKQFTMMKKMMKKTGMVNRLLSGGMDLGGSLASLPSKLSRGSNKTVSQKKKRKKRKKHRR